MPPYAVLKQIVQVLEIDGNSLFYEEANDGVGKMAEIYQVFRKAVLDLDPCVTEEVKKLYVAFKAETNFVDVVPQAKRLRLSLNMPFSEIEDPRGLCKDVTNLGRWGNGDVEVGLDNLDDLSHIMALVTQAFERQMGSDTI